MGNSRPIPFTSTMRVTSSAFVPNLPLQANDHSRHNSYYIYLTLHRRQTGCCCVVERYLCSHWQQFTLKSAGQVITFLEGVRVLVRRLIILHHCGPSGLDNESSEDYSLCCKWLEWMSSSRKLEFKNQCRTRW